LEPSIGAAQTHGRVALPRTLAARLAAQVDHLNARAVPIEAHPRDADDVVQIGGEARQGAVGVRQCDAGVETVLDAFGLGVLQGLARRFPRRQHPLPSGIGRRRLDCREGPQVDAPGVVAVEYLKGTMTDVSWPELWGELKAYIEEYRSAADALQAGEMDALDRFPEGSYRPQLPFLGMPAPPRPPAPPTRPLEIEEFDDVRRVVGRGPVPLVEVGGRMRSGSPDHPT
jgi:hypothetical protein